VASDLIIDNFYRPNNASTVSTTEYFAQQRLVSLYGEVTGAYKDFAYLTLTGRNDFSSTLPTNNNSYFYPSISGSFVFSEFLPKDGFLSFGNVRLSYAQVGSDTDPYSLQTLYSAPSTFFVQFSLPGTFPFLGQQGFTSPQVYPPTNLKPQIAGSFEFGTNLKFWDGRIGLDFTYYHTKTRDQILDIAVPRSTGYFSKTINAGAITNSGVEAVLDLNLIRPKVSDGFNWDLTVNFSRNRQIVNYLTPGDSIYSVASGWSGLQVKAVVGKPYALYGSRWRRSPDGQFVINPANGLRLTDPDQDLGNVNPDYIMGISNQFSYKGVTLGVLLDIRQGGVFYSGTVAELRSSGMVKETLANRGKIFIDKGVVATGTDANGKTTYAPNTTPVQSMQDFWANYSAVDNTEGDVFDASYMKLRSVTLSYTFPKKLLPFHGAISSLEVGFEGRNLWLIKSFVPHVDPELDFFGNASAGDGVEFNSFPTTRSMGVNVKIKF
jgi:outer membrane receptor protein involved in Fe transport